MDSRYRTEKADGVVTLWDDTTGIGLRFKEGETLSRYTSSIVLSDPSIMETEEGVEKVSRISEALTAQAERDYPTEFQPLNNNGND